MAIHREFICGHPSFYEDDENGSSNINTNGLEALRAAFTNIALTEGYQPTPVGYEVYHEGDDVIIRATELGPGLLESPRARVTLPPMVFDPLSVNSNAVGGCSTIAVSTLGIPPVSWTGSFARGTEDFSDPEDLTEFDNRRICVFTVDSFVATETRVRLTATDADGTTITLNRTIPPEQPLR